MLLTESGVREILMEIRIKRKAYKEDHFIKSKDAWLKKFPPLDNFG